MIHLIESHTDEEQIERLIKQRQVAQRILKLLKQFREERSSRNLSTINRNYLDLFLENHQFYVYRADTNQVLASRIQGYEAAKDKANQLRKSLNLRWDQVKFKVDRSVSDNQSNHQSNLVNPAAHRKVDYAKTYNPSKRMRFRGYYDSHGNYHDID